MSRHQLSESFAPLVVGGSGVWVPLNLEKFRRYRDMQAATATLGVTMALGFCSFPALFAYIWAVDPAERNATLGIIAVVLSLALPIFVGLAAWPAVQIAKTLTKTLREKLPALIINQQGIWDFSSNYVFGFIPWSEIDAVVLDSRYSRKLNKSFPGIAFVVKDKNVLLRRKPGLLSSWLSMESEITDRRRIFIPQGRLNMPVEDVVRLANSFRQQQTNESA